MKMNMETMANPGSGNGKPNRKVVVVADPGRESVGALEWAISHALVEHDELILLHIEPSVLRRHALSAFLKRPNLASVAAAVSTMESGGDGEFLQDMKSKCMSAKPKVRVRVARAEVEGKDKASAILLQAKLFSADVLVVGQRRSFLGMSYKGLDTADYLIENSGCPCVAVQKKQSGGFLLNSKTRRNFWLLA